MLHSTHTDSILIAKFITDFEDVFDIILIAIYHNYNEHLFNIQC